MNINRKERSSGVTPPNLSRARAKHLSALLAPPHPLDADLSVPPPPQFVATTCPDCGRDVMRLLGAADAEAGERLREVARLREEGRTLAEVGAAVGVSKSQARRILRGESGCHSVGVDHAEEPVLVEAEEQVAYGVRGPGAGQMRVVRLAHRPRCPGRDAA